MRMLYPPENTWEDPDTFNSLQQPSLDYTMNLMESAVRRLPWFVNAGFIGGWQELYDVIPDWMPIIDEQIKDLIIVVGLSGHGFKLAPAFALIVMEVIKYGAAKIFRNIFTLGRFREGREIKEQVLKSCISPLHINLINNIIPTLGILSHHTLTIKRNIKDCVKS